MNVAEPETGDTARLARLAELQRRRAAGVRSSGRTAASPRSVDHAPPVSRASSRAGVATGSKVAAAGVGFAAMLGLVAAMGYAGTSSTVEPQPAAQLPPVPSPVVVVIHPADGTGRPAAAPAVAGSVAPSTNQPIVLRAQPTVRQAPAASPAPVGQTHGSR